MDRDAWDERYLATELVWSAEPNRFVEAETESMAPGRVLDLAAGEGRNAIWLAENGWTATAVDFSRVALQKAAHLAAARGVALQVVEADVTGYEPEPGAFDLVLVVYLQTRAPDRARWLAHAVAALAPGATLLLVGHDRSNLDGGYGGPQDADVLTTPEELTDALAALGGGGLTIERADLVERSVDTPDGPRIAIDHLVRARRSP
ncbi:MAG: class I SAM-dependent methyltransferase [Acidimicrobiia bacterium]